MICQLLKLLSLFICAAPAFAQSGKSRLNTTMDSIFIKTINVYRDMDSVEQRVVMGRSIQVFKDRGRLVEDYQYMDTPQPHVGLVKEPAKSVCLYDDFGRRAEFRNYFTNGEARVKEVYSYSGLSGKSDGYYCPENKITNQAEYTLDNNSNIISSKLSTVGLNHYLIITSVYDKNDKVIKEEWHSTGGNITTRYLYKYDKNGDMIERREDFMRDLVITKTKVWTYAYEKYDSKHNWTIQNSYYQGKLNGIFERRIVYHK
jgi:hypothetical protein